MQLLFVGFAIFWTLRGWRADLVDDRRIMRWFIIGVQGALIFSVVFVENFLLEGGSANNASEQAVIVFAIALLTLTMLVVAMRFDLVSLSQAIRKVTELTEVSESEGAPSYDVDSFNSIFKGGQMYREADLRLPSCLRSSICQNTDSGPLSTGSWGSGTSMRCCMLTALKRPARHWQKRTNKACLC